MVRCPSVIVSLSSSVRRPSVVIHTFKLEYLWSQSANLDQILCVASLGLVKGCIRFWGRLDQKSGFHGNRKPQLTYNGENDISTFSRLFFYPIVFILAGNEDMHKISDEFKFWPDWTANYGALEHLKNSHRLIMGKCCFHASSFIFDRIIIKVAGNWDRHKSSDVFDFRPDQTTNFGVTCPWMTKILHFRTWISLRPVGQSWSNFMCSITGVGKGCTIFWGRLDQNSGVHENRKPPLTYNGENGVSTFSQLLLIWSFLYLQVTRTCIKSRTSSNFVQIGALIMELAAH